MILLQCLIVPKSYPLVMTNSLLLKMAIEIFALASYKMVMATIVFCMFTRGYPAWCRISQLPSTVSAGSSVTFMAGRWNMSSSWSLSVTILASWEAFLGGKCGKCGKWRHANEQKWVISWLKPVKTSFSPYWLRNMVLDDFGKIPWIEMKKTSRDIENLSIYIVVPFL